MACGSLPRTERTGQPSKVSRLRKVSVRTIGCWLLANPGAADWVLPAKDQRPKANDRFRVDVYARAHVSWKFRKNLSEVKGIEASARQGCAGARGRGDR